MEFPQEVSFSGFFIYAQISSSLLFFWLHYLSLNCQQDQVDSGLGCCLFYQSPLQDQFGLFVAGGAQGRAFICRLHLIWSGLERLWQFRCRYTNALFFSFAVFLDRVQWGSFLFLLPCSKRPLSSSALLVETNNVCLQTVVPSKAFIVFWPPKSMLHSNSFRLSLKIIMLVL